MFNWFHKPKPIPKTGNGHQTRQDLLEVITRHEREIVILAQKAGVSVFAPISEPKPPRTDLH